MTLREGRSSVMISSVPTSSADGNDALSWSNTMSMIQIARCIVDATHSISQWGFLNNVAALY